MFIASILRPGPCGDGAPLDPTAHYRGEQPEPLRSARAHPLARLPGALERHGGRDGRAEGPYGALAVGAVRHSDLGALPISLFAAAWLALESIVYVWNGRIMDLKYTDFHINILQKMLFPLPHLLRHRRLRYLSLMLIWHWILTPIVACHLVVRPWWATRMQGGRGSLLTFLRPILRVVPPGTLENVDGRQDKPMSFGGLLTVHPPCVLRLVLSLP